MAQYRKDSLVNGEVYHIYTRSIAGFTIFNDSTEYGRFFNLCNLYRFNNFNRKYSEFIELSNKNQSEIICNLELGNDKSVEIICFCLMPTHVHFALKQISVDGISRFMSLILNSYSRYFNARHKRTGPLWSGRFKNVLVGDDDQLLHLTRYIHLNPTSADLVKDPGLWRYSSFKEYIGSDMTIGKVCDFHDLIEMPPERYKAFVVNQKDYQRKISLIKYLIIDNYSG